MPYNRKNVYYIEGEWGGKVCTVCGWFRNWSEFRKEKTGCCGHRASCRVCERDYNKKTGYISQKKYNKKTGYKDRKYPARYKVYAPQLTVEESPRKTKEGYLEVKCANSNCREYFIPTNLQVRNRIQAMKNGIRGECRIYCSENCKNECSLFNQQKYPKGFKPETLDTEFPAFVKEEIFKRDKYKCQICGRTHDLQAHHEFPGSTHHMLSKDVKNGITLCKECHIKVHMLPGCRFSDIASCSQKN